MQPCTKINFLLLTIIHVAHVVQYFGSIYWSPGGAQFAAEPSPALFKVLWIQSSEPPPCLIVLSVSHSAPYIVCSCIIVDSDPACRRALLGFFFFSPFVHNNNHNKRIREVHSSASIHNRLTDTILWGKPPQLYLPVIMLLLITRKLLSELTSYASSFTATQVGWR